MKSDLIDITMCVNATCQLRENCYRNEASGTTPTPERQSWSAFEPNADGECSEFIPPRTGFMTSGGQQ